MKMRKWIVGCLAGLCCVGGIIFYFSHRVDAVSGATGAYGMNSAGALPPDSGDYEVLGVQDGIKNWSVKYDDTFIRGGEFYDDRAADVLKAWGVKTVVSITPTDKEREFCARNGIELVEIPFNKEDGLDSASIQTFLEAIREGKGPFYTHCVGGTHRGGVLGFAYRVHVLKWPHDRALVEYGRLGGDLSGDHAMLEAVRNVESRQ